MEKKKITQANFDQAHQKWVRIVDALKSGDVESRIEPGIPDKPAYSIKTDRIWTGINTECGFCRTFDCSSCPLEGCIPTVMAVCKNLDHPEKALPHAERMLEEIKDHGRCVGYITDDASADASNSA